MPWMHHDAAAMMHKIPYKHTAMLDKHALVFHKDEFEYLLDLSHVKMKYINISLHFLKYIQHVKS